MALKTLLRDEVSRRHYRIGTVPLGTTTDWIDLSVMSRVGREAIVACVPGVGGTMEVEYTLDTRDEVDTGTPDPIAWEPSTVSAATGRRIPTNITAVRFTAAVADGKYKVIV